MNVSRMASEVSCVNLLDISILLFRLIVSADAVVAVKCIAVASCEVNSAERVRCVGRRPSSACIDLFIVFVFRSSVAVVAYDFAFVHNVFTSLFNFHFVRVFPYRMMLLYDNSRSLSIPFLKKV